jgi:hypothetical protein
MCDVSPTQDRTLLRMWEHQLCFRLGPGTAYVALTSMNAPPGRLPLRWVRPGGTEERSLTTGERLPPVFPEALGNSVASPQQPNLF